MAHMVVEVDIIDLVGIEDNDTHGLKLFSRSQQSPKIADFAARECAGLSEKCALITAGTRLYMRNLKEKPDVTNHISQSAGR
jgi:hypothetical protein